MNLGASLSAFANDIPNAFGSAIDGKFLSTAIYKSDPSDFEFPQSLPAGTLH